MRAIQSSTKGRQVNGHHAIIPLDPNGEHVPLWEVEASITTAIRKAAAKRIRSDLRSIYSDLGKHSPELGRLAEDVPAEDEGEFAIDPADADWWASHDYHTEDWAAELLADVAIECDEPFRMEDEHDWRARELHELRESERVLARGWGSRASSTRVEPEDEARMYGYI